MSCLLRGRWEFCGTSRKMPSNLKYSNLTNQALNEGSCQLSVPFTILWVSFLQLCWKAKKIIQRLWKLQLGWDDPVPECELAHWEQWKTELSALAQVQIPRCHFQLHGEVREISLHQFSDASDEGYGMCSYLLFVYEDSSIQCSFLMGKSKAMPVRPISIRRLELQAATLSAKIYQVC